MILNTTKKLSLLCAFFLLAFITNAQNLNFNSSKNTYQVNSLLSQTSRSPMALAPDQAFDFSHVFIDNHQLLLSWHVAKNHYLYKSKIKIIQPKEMAIDLPQGEMHTDKFFGEQEIYKGYVEAVIDLKEKQLVSDIIVSYQGCSKAGICYPVITKNVAIQVGNQVSNISIQTEVEPANGISQTFKEKKSKNLPLNQKNKSSAVLEQSFESQLKGSFFVALFILLLAGIGLAFTPCVLPMLPILLGLISRNENMTRQKTAILSFAYALGIASMLAIFGIIVAKTGINLQIVFQKTWLLILFAVLFFGLGLSMLGVFKISVPSVLQSKVGYLQNNLRTDKFFSLYLAGALSILVVGPCVAPPLIAVLAYISTTNDSLLGGLYLFALGLGMGLPLTLFSIFAGKIPKKTKLSQLILKVFAILMFGVALWLLNRVVSDAVSLVLWGALGLFSAFVLWQSQLGNISGKVAKTIAILLLLISGSWIVGGSMGNGNFFNPFVKQSKLPFIKVENMDALNQLLSQNDKVMFDLYADWCVVCQEIEHVTLADKKVQDTLAKVTLAKLDITTLTDDNQEMMKQFDLFGPPALLFFSEGKEVESLRHIGFISASELINKIEQLKLR